MFLLDLPFLLRLGEINFWHTQSTHAVFSFSSFLKVGEPHFWSPRRVWSRWRRGVSTLYLPGEFELRMVQCLRKGRGAQQARNQLPWAMLPSAILTSYPVSRKLDHLGWHLIPFPEFWQYGLIDCDQLYTCLNTVISSNNSWAIFQYTYSTCQVSIVFQLHVSFD